MKIQDAADIARESELFKAFVAGFEASAEGFNGEYTHSGRYPTWPILEERLYMEFRREFLGLDSDVPA